MTPRSSSRILIAYAREFVIGDRAQHRSVTENDAALHAKAAHVLEDQPEAVTRCIEVLVHVKIDRLAMARRGREQNIEIACGVLGDRDSAADRIGALRRGVDIGTEPFVVLAGVRNHEGDELQCQPFRPVGAHVAKGVDPDESGVFIDIDVAANRGRATRQTARHRSGGARSDVARCHAAGERGKSIAGALQRAGRVRSEFEGPGFVQMLMRIDKTGRDGEAGNVNAERTARYGARFTDTFDLSSGGDQNVGYLRLAP